MSKLSATNPIDLEITPVVISTIKKIKFMVSTFQSSDD